MVNAVLHEVDYIEPIWRPMKKAKDGEDEFSIMLVEKYNLKECKEELGILTKYLRPSIRWMFIPSFRSSGDQPYLCAIDGQDCRQLYPQYIRNGVDQMIGFRPRRFVSFGDRINATYCPGHMRMEHWRQELEIHFKRLRDQEKKVLTKKAAEKKGLIATPIEYFKPTEAEISIEAKYGPIMAEMERDGFQISSYFPPADLSCPKCGHLFETSDIPDLTLIVADRRKMISTKGMQLPKEMVVEAEAEQR